MTRLTMRTLILAALLAAPACAADVDTPAGSPPQPAPAAISQPDEQAKTIDIIEKVDSFYHSAWSMLLIVITALILLVGVVVPLIIQHLQRKSFDDAKTDLETKIDTMREEAQKDLDDAVGKVKADLETQREALAAQKMANDRAMTNLLQKAAATSSNMAFAYLSSPTCQLEYGLVFISNAVFTQNEASNSAELVMDPMDRWLKAAARPTMPPLPDDEVPMEALRESWSQLVAVGGQRNDRLFWRKLETMEKRLREFLKGNDHRLGQIFGGAG